MARQDINLGTAPTGAGGDTTRSTGVKINQMSSELYSALGAGGNGVIPSAIPVNRGGTGGTTQAEAQAALGLGTAATRNVGTAVGNVLGYGSFGIGGRAPDIPGNSFNAIGDTGIYRSTGGTANSPANYGYGTLFVENYDAGFTAQHATSFSGRLFFRINNNFSWGSWGEIYTTMNTTRGSGGALSAASPIVRIANVAASERRDLLEQTFQNAGAWGVANEDARGVLVERLSIGEYRVTGSLGLALEGWRTHDPSSPDGGRMLGITDSQQDDSGNVIIRLFKQRWTLTDDGEMVPGRGAPMDVPLNSWIDVRLEMPKTDMPPPATSAEESQAGADQEASSTGEDNADQ
ncbi:pyocin knob domain-containing protein [Pseudomonas sp. Leaf59]|uniref:pyocin knob domain-containing protein n=1 Tax=Pseudomonas sp. Leaf59 TaxID=2876556 RepID=UPI001E45D189|nr:pyocin knob domain-containing protein [Pseudomonas sp. Leaf59]